MSKHLDPTRLDDRRIRANVAQHTTVDVCMVIKQRRADDWQKVLDKYRFNVVS